MKRNNGRSRLMAKKKKNEVTERIEKAYLASCSGIQVNIMDLSKIMRHGEELVARGATDEELQEGIRSFVELIRQN